MSPTLNSRIALETKRGADKRKTIERHQNDVHARSSQTACLRPLSFCLSRFPCRTNTLRASSTANNFCGVHFDFFFLRDEKTSVTTERSLLVTLFCSWSNSHARRTRGQQSLLKSKTKALLVKNNVPREILRPLRVRERPHFRTQSVLVRVPLRRVQTDACESRGRFCDGDLRVEDVREGVVR